MNKTEELFRLEGKVAVITGGAGLLGSEHMEALSDLGANIVLTDLNEDLCQEKVTELKKRKEIDAIAVKCDVTNKASWENLVKKTVSHFKKIDILLNNAAFTNQSKSANFDALFQDFPLEDWNQIMNVNLTGTFLGCQVIGDQMLKNRNGSIINFASLYGVVSPNHKIYPGTGISQPVSYSVSKAGVIALTRYLAGLWGETGVRVNCITPGGVFNNHKELFLKRFSDLNPIGRMADKSEMRGAVAYLASDASSYCNGHNLVVDGGWTIW